MRKVPQETDQSALNQVRVKVSNNAQVNSRGVAVVLSQTRKEPLIDRDSSNNNKIRRLKRLLSKLHLLLRKFLRLSLISCSWRFST